MHVCVGLFCVSFSLSLVGSGVLVSATLTFRIDISNLYTHRERAKRERERESRFRIFEIHTAKQIICGWMLLAFGAVARLRTDGDTMYSWISRVALLFVYCVCQFVKIRWFSISFVAFPIPSNEFSGINFPNCHCQNKFSLFHSISLIYNELHSMRKKSIRFQLLTIA